ncbi:MAG: excisionase family DNA-binding protein [Bacteroidota bacterium]
MIENNTLAYIENLLLAQKQVLNINEFCRYVGVSKSFCYKLTHTKAIPFYCPNGKLIFFNRDEVDKWLLSNPINPVADVEQETINYIANKAWRGGKV